MSVFVKPDEQSEFTCTLPWREKVGEAKEKKFLVKSGKDSIRNFKFQPNKGCIVIDEPDEDDYHFHIK